MAFYIYQNFPNQSVKIHRGDCGFCNNGNGLQQNILGNANGLWHPGPDYGYQIYLSALTDAQYLALQMGIDAQHCLVCNPSVQQQ